MKKLKYLLLLLLFIPFLVKAELKDVEIKKIELVNKSPLVTELEPASFNDLELSVKLKFTSKDEFARYQLTIKNNSNKDYEIDNSSTYNEGDFIKYEYILNENEKVLKANSEITMSVMITYYKELSTDKFENRKYIEDNNVSIELSNLGEEVIDNGVMRFATNPDTSTSDIIKIVVILAIMSAILVLVLKSKKGKVFIIIMMLLIPVMTYAIEKIKLDIATHVEIVDTKKFYIAEETINNSGNPVAGEAKEYSFEEGMTLDEWVHSVYNVDNYDFSYEITTCIPNERFLYPDETGVKNTDIISLGADHILIENNVYVTGLGSGCIA